MDKLKVKDLVTIGIFAVIYSIVMFAVGMIGLVPILFWLYVKYWGGSLIRAFLLL